VYNGFVMSTSFDAWVAFAFGTAENNPGGEEGGWNPTDPSPDCPTWRGIEYTEWCQWCHASMTFEGFRASCNLTAIKIFVREAYWNRYRVDLLPAGGDVLYADGVFNGGGVENLQRTLNTLCGLSLEADGVLGPATLAAMEVHLPTIAPRTLIDAYAAAAEVRYRRLAKFPQYGGGWLARLGRCHVLATKLAGVVPAIQET